MPVEVKPQNTAIFRGGPSRPLRDLYDNTVYIPEGDARILDWGCGKGDDAQWLRSKGYRHVIGWDPYLDSDPRPGAMAIYDVVLCIYVLCVLADKAERRNVVLECWDRVAPGGCMLLAVRGSTEIEKEALRHDWERYRDGYITSQSRRTFQHGFTEHELAKYVMDLPNVAYIEYGTSKDYVSVNVLKREKFLPQDIQPYLG